MEFDTHVISVVDYRVNIDIQCGNTVQAYTVLSKLCTQFSTIDL